MSSLYIHIPFCQKKCFYCSFAVSVGQEHRMDLYLDCLAKEAAHFRGQHLETIYVGGGTPTYLPPQQLKKLIYIIKNHFEFHAGAEFTMEANPEGLSPDKAKLLFDLGVNRVSLGVQSLQDKHLKFLGRCHSADTALAAFRHLRKAGFDNINLDLMYSFPGQTQEDIIEDVHGVTRLGSEHVSLYTLTVEPHSRFYVQKITPPDGELQAGQYVLVTRLLKEAGFHQYEISNFAKPDRESRHNLNYWRGGDYIGLGMAAHSHREGRRFWNVVRLTDYISKMEKGSTAVESQEFLKQEERFIETLLFGLRTNQGVDLFDLENRFSCRLSEEKVALIDQFARHGWLIRQGNRLRTSSKGQLLLDELSAKLI